MKEEALKLADELDNFLKEEEQLPWGTKQVYLDMASTMIRRLVEELDKPELNDGGFPVKNATYWKRQYNLMYAQNDRLKSGIYHANEQIKYLESLAPQTKPLSDDEIVNLLKNVNLFDMKAVVRAIEERHGIKNVQKT